MSQIQVERKQFSKWSIDLAIHRALESSRRRSTDCAFHDLLSAVVSRSDMLRTECGGGNAGWRHAESVLRGLLALAEHRKNWLREIDDWMPRDAGLLPQFGSLASHLLARRLIPNFMRLVWFEEPSSKARRHHKLYKHLGLGNSVRGANLPIPLTKEMASHFARAPDQLTVEQAVRWSQIRGWGGDERFAAAVLNTPLGESFEHERFWARILQLLIRQRNLNAELVPAIIALVRAQRDRPAAIGLAFRREGLSSLMEEARVWMARNPEFGKPPRLRWRPSSIGGFTFTEPQAKAWSLRQWTIRKLTNSRELIEEGNALHHCVARYGPLCAARASSIWSLQCHGTLSVQRVLTIEVLPATRTIVTALGTCNTRPRSHARTMMEMWAQQEGLKIATWI